MESLLSLKNLIFQKINQGEKVAILTVGSILKGDDGAGPILFELFLQEYKEKSPNIFLRNSDTMPENYLKPIINFKPSLLILIDAIEANEAPGKILIYRPETIDQFENFSTHNIPLTLFIKQIQKQIQSSVILIGIQIESNSFGVENLSKPVQKAVYTLGTLFKELFDSIISKNEM